MSYYKRRKLRCLHECESEAHYLQGLNKYIQYGLRMRELLEHDGPYEFKNSVKPQNEYFHIGSIESESALKSHKVTYSRLAAESLIVSSFSLFEFLLANTFIELHELSQTENGEFSPDLHLVWNESDKNNFAQLCLDEGVGSDEWRNRNHLWEEQKRKIGLLDKHLSTKIKTEKTKCGYSWQQFCNSRADRISIVHSTGKQTIFGGRAHENTEAVAQSAMNTLNWVIWLSNRIEQSLYALPVLKDDRAGKRAPD